MDKILIVDDSPTQVYAISAIFSSGPNRLEVQSVKNGLECLEELERRDYSAVILDYILPDIDGLTVLSKIREKGMKIPVIMITGQGDEQIAVEAMKAGAADYITKSPDFMKILPVVLNQVLEKENLRNRLSAARESFRQLSQISLDISLEINLEELGQLLIEGMRRLTKSKIAVLLLHGSENGESELLASAGLSQGDGPIQDRLRKLQLWEPLVGAETPINFPPVKGEKSNPESKAENPGGVMAGMVVPLLNHGEITGRLLVADPFKRKEYTDDDLDALVNLGVHASMAIENARYVKRTERQAMTDSLTGLYNHMEFQKRMDEEIERSDRYGRKLSVLMIDIDHFKSINDTYGHQFGDKILKEMANLIRKQLRNADIPARYGGEEFSVILPETPADGAVQVAERIRVRVLESEFDCSDARVKITLSIGVAGREDFQDRISIISAADKALYLAKEAGRNRVFRLNQKSFEKVEKSYSPLETLQTNLLEELAAVGDRKSSYLQGYSGEVARLTQKLSNAMGLSDEETEGLRQAGLLHHVGYANIPDRVLEKRGPLTDEEQKIIRAHPTLAEMMLRESADLKHVLPAILYHHERYDGKGYPSGLKGDKIPLSARVLSVASSYQAMVSDRPYRKAMSVAQALAKLQKGAGSQFDPKIVEVFLHVIDGRPEKK